MPKLSEVLELYITALQKEQILSDWLDQNNLRFSAIRSSVRKGCEKASNVAVSHLHQIYRTVDPTVKIPFHLDNPERGHVELAFAMELLEMAARSIQSLRSWIEQNEGHAQEPIVEAVKERLKSEQEELEVSRMRIIHGLGDIDVSDFVPS